MSCSVLPPPPLASEELAKQRVAGRRSGCAAGSGGMARWASGRVPPPDPAPHTRSRAACRVRGAASHDITCRFVLLMSGSCMPHVMIRPNYVNVAKYVSDHRIVALRTRFTIHEPALCQKVFYERIDIRVQSMTSVRRTQGTTTRIRYSFTGMHDAHPAGAARGTISI
jgi:hypothetical protein